jgi:hypothetical protein
MNCIDFRREALAQPLRLSAPSQEHAAGCAACRAFLERQRQLDVELLDAVRVPVPDNLADRILVAHGLRDRRRPWGWAIAATVLLAAGIAWVPPFFSGRSLASEAIAHVFHEPFALAAVDRHEPRVLDEGLASQGVRAAGALGQVTFATFCPSPAGRALHLVVTTPAGPVTLILYPSDGDRRRRALVESRGMTAILLPAARGSIAIVAPSRDQALAFESSLILS